MDPSISILCLQFLAIRSKSSVFKVLLRKNNHMYQTFTEVNECCFKQYEYWIYGNALLTIYVEIELSHSVQIFLVFRESFLQYWKHLNSKNERCLIFIWEISDNNTLSSVFLALVSIHQKHSGMDWKRDSGLKPELDYTYDIYVQ